MPEKPIAAADLDLVLQHTEPLWDDLRHQRLFLTGGTGFFGTWLLSSFLHANQSLGLNATATVLTRNSASFIARAPHLANHSAITLLAGELLTFAPPRGSFDFVIHAATDVASPTIASPEARYASIVDGTARMLDFAATHATRKFLLTSSGAVYGKQPPTLTHIPEDYAPAPEPLTAASAYAEGKRASERRCAQHARQFSTEFKIARCFACVGLYAADLAVWLWTILFKAPALEAFNVGSEESLSIADLAALTATTLNPQLSVHIAQQPTSGASPLRYVPSTQRAKQQLGLCQTVSLSESIRRTAAWHRS
jgi:nucleoside-diphosphate-sugar epimerase